MDKWLPAHRGADGKNGPYVTGYYTRADITTSHHSEHRFMPANGAAFVASKIDAIAANSEVWAKTLFILNYDENDGLFDHVPPPVPREGTAREFFQGLPFGAGSRVPCIIVPPRQE